MTLPVAILAGGRGTRLQALATNRPKALVTVANEPFLAHQLRLLRRSGFEDVLLCVGHLGDQIASFVGDGEAFGLRARYSWDGPDLLGTGGAIRRALPLLGAAFFVVYGDSYLRCDYSAICDAFLRAAPDCDALMTIFHNRNQWGRSNVVYRDGAIIRYDKQTTSPDMEHIDYGVSIYKREAFDTFTDAVAFDLGDVCRKLLGQGRLSAYEIAERFYEIGTPAGLIETEALIEAGSHDL